MKRTIGIIAAIVLVIATVTYFWPARSNTADHTAAPNASSSGGQQQVTDVIKGVQGEQKNLIVIQLESYQSFVLGKSINGQEITPNLNKLIEESVYFPHFYLQNGAGNTSDAEFMLNTSLFPFEPYRTVSADGADSEYPSLPRMLKGSGYSTVTMHTNNAMFFNRKNLYSALGFDRYLDKEFFGTNDYVAFGASDDELYGKGLDVLKEYQDKKQPFYAHMVSMTSHYPFTEPKKFQLLELPELYEGNMAGNYLQATHYADAALGRFIDQLKEAGLWDNTILAIYGDHTGIQLGMLDDKISAALKDFLGRDYNQADALGVPFLIHDSSLKPEKKTVTGGHMDMLPTLLHVLGLSIPSSEAHLFGYDLFTGQEHPVGVRGAFAEPGTFVENGILYNPKDETALNVETDIKVEGQKDVYADTYDKVMASFKESDAYIASLPNRGDGFPLKLTLTEKTPLYSSPDLTASLNQSVPASDVEQYEARDDGWYRIKVKDNMVWIKPNHPIVEVWKNATTKADVKTNLYKSPDDTTPVVTTLGPETTAAVSKEWVGTGWFCFYTWAGELWGNVEK
ncbi:LTA synthase family protein [Gorillibacterium massiliense]|uniref:LTA synthase family protein n=1 Tax=Gorillibacterium massiliense TaxID=1280390 RepID=UPI0004B1D0DC|nr:LTA synthase family protein [Gorillibacterium massiliense]